MARVTVEDCLRNINNRFALVLLASERARQIHKGSDPLIECSNKVSVTALREIAAGKVHFRQEIIDVLREQIAKEKKI